MLLNTIATRQAQTLGLEQRSQGSTVGLLNRLCWLGLVIC